MPNEVATPASMALDYVWASLNLQKDLTPHERKVRYAEACKLIEKGQEDDGEN